MKTMTCRQMGGPCDYPIHGNTADDVMNKGTAHIKEMIGKGDEEHKKVKSMMDEMQKNPDSAKEWNNKFMKDFAALPEDK
jgi:hypothetical protein